MKNTMKKWLVVMSVLVALSAMLVGCGSAPDEFKEKSYTASAEEVDSITIDTKDRKIEILPSEDKQIHITYYENDKEFYNIALSGEKELSMTSADSKQWNDYIGGKSAQKVRIIQVWIPDATLKNLNLKTSNEDISVPSLSFASKAELRTNNGNIEINRLNVGTEVTLEAKNGDINGSIVGTFDDFAISSKVKKGKSNLPANKKDGSKKLSAYANNGDISIEFVNSQ